MIVASGFCEALPLQPGSGVRKSASRNCRTFLSVHLHTCFCLNTQHEGTDVKMRNL
jgi:hypothetical protein